MGQRAISSGRTRPAERIDSEDNPVVCSNNTFIKSQAAAVRKYERQRADRYTSFFGEKIICAPKVGWPRIDTELLYLAARSNVGPGQLSVFEPFCGTGAIGLLFAKQGAQTLMIDISSDAVANALRNARALNVMDRVKVLQADVFPEGKQKFDLIVANPPYTDHPATNTTARIKWDPNHESVRRFLKGVKSRLKKFGEIYMSWASYSGYSFIEKLFLESGLEYRTVLEFICCASTGNARADRHRESNKSNLWSYRIYKCH